MAPAETFKLLRTNVLILLTVQIATRNTETAQLSRNMLARVSRSDKDQDSVPFFIRFQQAPQNLRAVSLVQTNRPEINS
jgi:hypothetical protein